MINLPSSLMERLLLGRSIDQFAELNRGFTRLPRGRAHPHPMPAFVAQGGVVLLASPYTAPGFHAPASIDLRQTGA